MFFRLYSCLLAICFAMRAQPLSALADEALRHNREILAAQKKYEAARQIPAQASALADPTLSVGYTANGAPYPVAGIGRDVTSNAGVMVSQELPFPGKRQLRGDIAAKEASAEFQQYLAVRLSVTSRLKQAYHELHHANVSITFVKRYQDLLQKILRISEARYTVARAAQQDIFKAQTQFAIFETQLLRYEQERTAKQIEINALLNRPQGGAIDVPDDMDPGELTIPLDELLAGARTHAPSLAREQKIVERNDLSSALARKSVYPDYTVSGGYFNQGSMPPMWQFRVDFKIPAWYRTKQHAEITEKAFSAVEARHNYEAADVALQAQVRAQYTAAVTSRKLIDLYRKSVVPGSQLALESSIASYETGTLDFLSLFSNFMNVVEYELMVHEEIMQFHVALARLEELTGVAL
uniref:Outer membrane efflux protein n=1 Tax=Solibacter usitatus (strain Ellin6076) TaxID=234267 RepID=Q01PK0_SOLUE